ncbi:hypothetical protein ACOMHN_064477 [Nucella lapillus]
MADNALVASGPAPSAPSVSHNMLMNAISSGSVEAVRQHITQEPELVNMFGWHRQTALHRACLVGHVDIVRVLLEAGADPNARNSFDETAVHYACKRGLPPVVQCVLRQGGDVAAVDRTGKGVVHHAAEAGTVSILHLLHTAYPELSLSCADSNLQTPLHLAVKAGKLEAFKYLLRNGRSRLKQADREGNWPVHLSAQQGYGHMTWTQLCILGLPALHVANNHGCTPYHLATMYDTAGHKELVGELRWARGQSDRGSARQRAYLLWVLYLTLPLLSFGAALVLTRFIAHSHALVLFLVIVVNVIAVKNSSHRMHHVSRWPQPIHAGVFAAGLLYTMLAYITVILPHLDGHTILRSLTYVLAVAIVALYLRLITTDPGVLSSSAQDEQTGRALSILDVCASDKWQTFCTDCELVRPAWTKHCKLCERCMLGMDHHCLFLLRCIAANNHVLFVAFVALCVACMALFLAVGVLYVRRVYPSLALWGVCAEMAQHDAWLLAMLLLNAGALVWGVSLLLFQCGLVAQGQTAYFRQSGTRGGTGLSGAEKLMNVVNFLTNRRPHGVSPSTLVAEKTEVV